MTLPPKLRALQQSWSIQVLLIPAIITAVVAGGTSMLAASGGDLTTLTRGSLRAAFGIGMGAALTYILAIVQHGLGSASFHKDGSENKLVATAAGLTQEMPGPIADTQRVRDVVAEAIVERK